MTNDNLTNKPNTIDPQFKDLDPQSANVLLNNVFEECGMEPSSIPVETLASWSNYNRPKFRYVKRIIYISLLILILLPLAFLKPNIVAERVDVDSPTNATYEVSVKTMLPVKALSATLDGVPISVEQTGSKEFRTTASKNGLLELTAVSLNGQVTKAQYQVEHLDMDAPVYTGSFCEDGLVHILVKDTFSGIDIDNVEGLEPVSYSEETGDIAFAIPDEPTSVVIHDKAGNNLNILLSPVSN
ncbi:MAG: hypothetical protein PUJ11_01655 [Eubacteriaceae bacterium]|nr:hypothetical protein [Eubacteriaceae bacterium]